jgi:hypothetical protein
VARSSRVRLVFAGDRETDRRGADAQAVVALGWWVSRSAKRVEDLQWARRKLVDERLDVYKEMAPALNDLYCVFHFKGGFREIDPPTIIDRKRKLDASFHVNQWLFSHDFRQLYAGFMEECFNMGRRMGRDAAIRLSADALKRERGETASKWEESWNEYFATDNRTRAGEAYTRLMGRFADELGVGAKALAPPDESSPRKGPSKRAS